MQGLTTKVVIMAATLVIAAGVASAQVMRAAIPFTFRASATVMAPGTYRVYLNSGRGGAPLFRLENEDSSRPVLVIPYAPIDVRKAWKGGGGAALVFECGSNCALIQLWAGSDDPAYAFCRPKPARDEDTHLVVVPMRPDKGE
jgi:hypothetical protein